MRQIRSIVAERMNSVYQSFIVYHNTLYHCSKTGSSISYPSYDKQDYGTCHHSAAENLHANKITG